MQPPSEEVDQAWSDLYNCRDISPCFPRAHRLKYFLPSSVGISRISQTEADNLLSKPVRAPADQDTYVVELDVWHQLHCLVRSHFIPSYETLVVDTYPYHNHDRT